MRHNVLIVDDEQQVCEQTAVLLEKMNIWELMWMRFLRRTTV